MSIQLQSDARLKEITESTGWRLTEPLRRVNAVRRRLRRALGLVAQRAADVLARDDRRVGRDPGAVAQAREALGQREGARLEQPPQDRLLARRAR